MTGAGVHKLFSLQAPKSTYAEILGEKKTNILEIFSNTTHTQKNSTICSQSGWGFLAGFEI